MSEASSLHLFEGFGVELEYMIVDADSLNVLPIADELLRLVAGEYVNDVERGEITWSNELALHVIELKTTEPVPQFDGLAAKFQENIREINERLAPLGGRLMPTAMHPWMDSVREFRLWPHEYSPVYEAFNRIFDCRGHGWANLQSVHLNLPFANDEEFARLHAAVRLLLPILPALAASSPIVEGRLTGFLDSRMEVYRTNSARIPSITGLVVPEPVSSRAEYEQKILQRIYRDIAPHDPSGVLQHEWLNARGAIARFDRNAIEVRVLDVQECPAVDVAICAAIVGALKVVLDQASGMREGYLDLPTEQLHTTFRETIRDAEDARIADGLYLQRLGMASLPARGAGELWQDMYWGVDEPLPIPAESRQPLEAILETGPLARRLIRTLSPDPSRARMERVYRELCDCLAQGRLFGGGG
jgi:gamma-glutamyl:cysteine ligase YbdK (ATP-grasp superfamily)